MRDGTSREVRTCYDYLTVLDLMPDDLTPTQRKEMITFFWNELAGDGWMHALSPRDPDAAWNRRADHTWCGSYPAWPAYAQRSRFATIRANGPPAGFGVWRAARTKALSARPK